MTSLDAPIEERHRPTGESWPEVASSGTDPMTVTTITGFIDHLLGYFVTPDDGRRRLLAGTLPVAALVAGAFVTIIPATIGIAFLGLVALVALTAYRPHYAGYIMVAVAPAIVGFGRGQILPLLRPNEALLFLLWVVLAARWLVVSRRITVQLNRMDFLIVGLVVTGMVLPLLVQFARLRPVGADDVFYAFVITRLGMLYAIIRYTIRTPGEVRTAIGFSLFTASGLGLLGLMDSLNLLNTAERLNPYFPNAGFIVDDGRGAATIGNPIGFGVYCGINACLALAMLLGDERPRPVLAIAAVCCGLGVFGSGQIGPSLSFVVGLVALALVTRSTGRLLRWSLPFVLVGSIVIAPLARERLAGFDGPDVTSAQRQDIANIGGQEESRELFLANPGSSWSVRLHNLETFFLPEFDDDLNLWLGVSPQARVPSPNEGEEFIWIESGHLWLLWAGGVPLFTMFFAFLLVGGATARTVMRTVPGPVGICGAAGLSALVIVAVAQTFDPHLTLRGTSDVLFPLLGLVVVGWNRRRVATLSPPRPTPSLLYLPDLAVNDRDRLAGADDATSSVSGAGPTPGVVVVTGWGTSQRFTTNDAPIRIGRGHRCQVRFDDPSVSRLHLVVHWDGLGWSVVDRSRHGTFDLDGNRLDGSQVIDGANDFLLGGRQRRPIEIIVDASDETAPEEASP